MNFRINVVGLAGVLVLVTVPTGTANPNAIQTRDQQGLTLKIRNQSGFTITIRSSNIPCPIREFDHHRQQTEVPVSRNEEPNARGDQVHVIDPIDFSCQAQVTKRGNPVSQAKLTSKGIRALDGPRNRTGT